MSVDLEVERRLVAVEVADVEVGRVQSVADPVELGQRAQTDEAVSLVEEHGRPVVVDDVQVHRPAPRSATRLLLDVGDESAGDSPAEVLRPCAESHDVQHLGGGAVEEPPIFALSQSRGLGDDEAGHEGAVGVHRHPGHGRPHVRPDASNDIAEEGLGVLDREEQLVQLPELLVVRLKQVAELDAAHNCRASGPAKAVRRRRSSQSYAMIYTMIYDMDDGPPID